MGPLNCKSSSLIIVVVRENWLPGSTKRRCGHGIESYLEIIGDLPPKVVPTTELELPVF